jgi:hypothetical protein
MFALFSALFTIVVHSGLSPALAGVHLTRSVSLSTLYICCNTEADFGYLLVMACHWDFSDDSSCLQYFRNLASGTSAILVYAQFHNFFIVCHTLSTNAMGRQPSLAHFRQPGVSFITLCKVISTKTTLSNIRFPQITKSNHWL